MPDFIIFTDEGIQDELDGWVNNSVNPGSFRLFKEPVTSGHAAEIADFIECDFVGYEPILSLAFGASYVNGMGQIQSDSPTLRFDYTAGEGTATAYGFFCTNSAQDKVLFYSSFNIGHIFDATSPLILSPSIVVSSQV